MTTQQNSIITTNSDIDLDNFLVTVEDNQDVIIIDTCKNRIGVNTIDPSYSIDVRSRQDISGTIYTSCLKTGNIISSLIPHTDNPDMSHNLGSTNKSWKRIDASYIEISGVTIKDANQFTIGEGSGGAGIVFPSDISINGDMCCNNIAVDGITINDANKFTIGEATNQSGITFPLDISINGNLTVTGTVNSTYLESLAQNTETELQYQFDNFRTDSKIIAYNVDVSNIDVSNINIKENILFNNIAPKQDETVVYDGNNIKWKTRSENLVNYVQNNVDNNIELYQLGSDLRGTSINDWDYFGFTTAINHDGTRIAVSSRDDNNGGTENGAVWFYNWNETTSTWDTVNLVYNDGSTSPYLQMGIVGNGARLGWSMEMSNDGTHLIISAPFSDNDDNVGFIQILQYFTVDTSEHGQEGWHLGEETKYRWNNRNDLSYNSNDPNPYWGWSVSINNDGRFIAFSAPGNETSINKGAVLVYEWKDGLSYDDSSYVQLGNMIQLDNTELFGQAIQLSEPPNYISGGNNDSSGIRIVIGERNGKFYDGETVVELGERGKVYVFEYSNGNWNQMNVLSGTSFEGSGTNGNNTWLGTSVAISKDGNRIAVGEPGYKTSRYNDVNLDTGIVHIYNYNIYSNGWELLHSIDAPPLSYRFGSGGSHDDSVKLLSFSYDKTKFAIGNFGYNNNKGAVYIYQYNNNLNRYILSDSIKSTYGDDLCGHSAVLSGDGKKIIIGCRKYSSGQGRAQVWKLPENRLEYGLSYKLGSNIYGISGEDASGNFLSPEYNYIGNSVALSDNGKIMVTGGAQTEFGGDGRARIYVWSDISNDWVQQGSTINGITNSKFGECVDITGDGSRIVIGAGADARWSDGSSLPQGTNLPQPGYFEVYDYNSSNNTYTLVGSRVEPEDVINSFFGQQVAISKNGSRVVVSSGIYNWGVELGNSIGGFILYEYNENNIDKWDKIGYVKGIQSYSYFGGHFKHGIGFSDDGNRICVGINRYNSDFRGRVEVWEYDGVSSNESSRSDKFNLLYSYEGNSGDQLGSSATISGNGKVIATGSINYDSNNYGAAYIWYEDNNGQWQSKGQTVPLRSDNDALDDGGVSEEVGQQMGAKNIKLSQDGNILIVNIPNTYNVGSVICFEYIPSLDDWEDMKEFIGPTSWLGTNSWFGSGFALTRDGSILAIGAPRYKLYTEVNAGYIEVHDISNLKIKENTIYSKSNSDNKLRILPKKARQPPTITLLGDVNMSLSTSQVYTEPGAVATDYRGIQIVADISGTVDVTIANVYTIDYSATDREGRTSQTVTRTVTVT